MLQNIDIHKVLFLDIETVSNVSSFDELDDEMQKFWTDKSKYYREKEGCSVEESYERAGIYAEFGKIVCISVGFLLPSGSKLELRLKSFYGDDEKTLLTEFAEMLNRHFNSPSYLLCAHNGKEFDFPYICRRMLINGIKIPYILDIAGKKPWEVRHIDTMVLWKFGDYKHYTSLSLLAKIFNIPSPKDDIDGSQVGQVFWEEKDLDRIENYCRKDVETVANILLAYLNLEPIDSVQIA